MEIYHSFQKFQTSFNHLITFSSKVELKHTIQQVTDSSVLLICTLIQIKIQLSIIRVSWIEQHNVWYLVNPHKNGKRYDSALWLSIIIKRSTAITVSAEGTSLFVEMPPSRFQNYKMRKHAIYTTLCN